MSTSVMNITEAKELSTRELIRHITNTHHKAEEKLIQDLDQYLRILMKVHYDEHGTELAAIYKKFLEFHGELAEHFAKEEREEFRKIRDGEVFRKELLLAEHQNILALTDQLSDLTDGFTPPADGCETYQAAFKGLGDLGEDLKLHFALEEEVLFQ